MLILSWERRGNSELEWMDIDARFFLPDYKLVPSSTQLVTRVCLLFGRCGA